MDGGWQVVGDGEKDKPVAWSMPPKSSHKGPVNIGQVLATHKDPIPAPYGYS